MGKRKAVELLRIFSALESWSFCCKERLPDYLQDKLTKCIEDLVGEILKHTEEE